MHGGTLAFVLASVGFSVASASKSLATSESARCATPRKRRNTSGYSSMIYAGLASRICQERVSQKRLAC